MKKHLILLLALALILCLAACGEPAASAPQEFVFPEGTVIAGQDVSGETRAAAWANIEAAAGNYTLALTVDGNPVHADAKDIALTCSYEKFAAGADALEAGTEADFSRVIGFNDGKLRLLLNRSLNKPAKDAAIVYDEAAGQYVVEAHEAGLKTDHNALSAALKDAIRALTPELSVTGFAEVLTPAWTGDAPETQAVLEQVNKMLQVELSYSFSTSESTNAHQIPAETLRSFVSLGEDGFTPSVDQELLDAYVAELSDKYSLPSVSGPFQTTGGSTVNLTIYYDGLNVDTAGLAQDITHCLMEGISGNRTAPYLDSGIRDIAYGGTYIEINLNTQHLWFYKKGELLLSTPFVSGCVAENNHTPTGVYQIYGKSSDLYLVGPTWRDWVSYWMPFYGGYGMHDATWRDEFGGDIYLYEGSHGCVNLPLEAAGIIYNNAPIGTRVIIYGGKNSVPDLPQELTGTTAYDLADDAKSFKLDVKAKYEDPKLTYTSDNPDVATVSKDGTVTVKGIGTAKITVSAAEVSYYTGGETTVTISVHSACDEGRHTMSEPTVTQKPTCQPGKQEAVCAKCGYEEKTVLEPVKSHTFGDWVTVKEPTCTQEGLNERTCTRCEKEKETETLPKLDHLFEDGPVCTVCGAKNPDYVKPSEEEEASE